MARVGEQAHDDVGLGDRVGGVEHAEPGVLGLGTRLAEPGTQPDPDVEAGVLQVLRVRVALRLP